MEEGWENWYLVNLDGVNITWGDFVNWYSNLPIYGQILTIIGILAFLTLVCVAVYYILKGIAYLLYYLFKGIGYLFYYIGLGIYKIFEGIYYAVTGKQKQKQVQVQVNEAASPQIQNDTQHVKMQNQTQKRKHVRPDRYVDPVELKKKRFCPMCGASFSETAKKALEERGRIFCSYCGSSFAKKPADMVES